MRLLSLRTRQSAAYKGLFALMMQKGSQDFMSGDPISHTTGFALPVDIHHIFPRAWCRKKKVSDQKCNSIVNKAPLTSPTNRKLGGNAPSEYLDRLVRDGTISSSRLEDVLKSHWIEPHILRNDAFEVFLRHRAIQLLDAIETAMGRPVQGRSSEEVIGEFSGPLVCGDSIERSPEPSASVN